MSKNSDLMYQFKDAAQRIALRIKENDPKNILNPSFKYTPSSKTDIRETFKRIKKELKIAPQNQDNNKPLVPPPKISLDKPLVEPILNPGGFVLPAEWFEMG
jgi:hypothetical protein